MGEPHVISALARKRAELLGEIEYLKELLKTRKQDLLTIDSAILVFDPGYELSSITPKRQYNSFFKRTKGASLVLDFLRGAGKPIIIKALREHPDTEVGDNPLAHESFRKLVYNILNRLMGKGLVERTETYNEQYSDTLAEFKGHYHEERRTKAKVMLF